MVADNVIDSAQVHVPQRGPGNLTEEHLAAHDAQLQAIDEDQELQAAAS